MSLAHRDPEYLRNARLIRQQTKQLVAAGRYVPCIRCNGPIGQTFDVGHVIDAARGGSHDVSNLGPQHRHRVGGCRGNRREGGTLGARKTNALKKRGSNRQNHNEGHLPW